MPKLSSTIPSREIVNVQPSATIGRVIFGKMGKDSPSSETLPDQASRIKLVSLSHTKTHYPLIEEYPSPESFYHPEKSGCGSGVRANTVGVLRIDFALPDISCPHPPASSPRAGEGEPDSKSLSRSGLRCTQKYLKPLQSLPPLVPPCKGGKHQISLGQGDNISPPPWQGGVRGGLKDLCVHGSPALGEGLRVRATKVGCTPEPFNLSRPFRTNSFVLAKALKHCVVRYSCF
jgi:hypothetical protein